MPYSSNYSTTETGGTLSNSFYKATVTLAPKLHNGLIKKENNGHLTKSNHNPNAIPIQTATQFFTDLEKTILNFIWKKTHYHNKTKKSRIAKAILNKRAARGITILILSCTTEK